MSLRFNVERGSVSFIGKSGGGKSNPIVDQLITRYQAGDITADNWVDITAEDLSEVYSGDAAKLTPSNVVYSFKKRTGVRMGYRRTAEGFWLFVKE